MNDRRNIASHDEKTLAGLGSVCCWSAAGCESTSDTTMDKGSDMMSAGLCVAAQPASAMSAVYWIAVFLQVFKRYTRRALTAAKRYVASLRVGWKCPYVLGNLTPARRRERSRLCR